MVSNRIRASIPPISRPRAQYSIETTKATSRIPHHARRHPADQRPGAGMTDPDARSAFDALGGRRTGGLLDGVPSMLPCHAK